MKIKKLQKLIDILRGKEKFCLIKHPLSLKKQKFFYDLYLHLFEIKKAIYLNFLSSNRPETLANIIQPTIFSGEGEIILDKTTTLGWYGHGLYFGNGTINANLKTSKIKIGKDTILNNGFLIVSWSSSIEIGDNCNIGRNFTCYDSDFHPEAPQERRNPDKLTSKPIKLGDNLFIGDNVTILKGVSIGKNSIIGANSTVTSSFGDNVIIAGNPAKFVRYIKGFEPERERERERE